MGIVQSGVLPVENDLTGVAGAHNGECLLVFPPGEAMRNDRRDIEATSQHHGHLVPGFLHLAAIDALDSEHAKDHAVPIDMG